MSKEIYISSTPHETRLAIVEHDELTEIYYERENEYTLAGSIYNGKVTRVLPGMQSSFVDVGLERDAFLYITDFMEEAGDSADFDGSETRGRSNGRRNDRSRGSQPGDLAGADATQGSAFSEGASSPSATPSRGEGLDDDRLTDRNARGDRNDRGRRRGRGGNRDMQAREIRPVADAAPLDEQPATPPSLIPLDTPEPGSEADLGEGAPGADGSRRWRGRRGRRRGRGGSREVLPVNAATPGYSEIEAVASGADPSSGYDLAEPDEDLELEASSAPEPKAGEQSRPFEPLSEQPEITPSLAASEASFSEASPKQREDRTFASRDGGDRGRRDRGGRGRDRRDDRPRAPRGFAPSRALYGVEEVAPGQPGIDAPAMQPMILPGESLSKYRQGGEGSQAASLTPPAAAAPAPEFRLQGAWDGGNVLPGETLRPRTSSTGGGSEVNRDGGRHGARSGGYEARRNDRVGSPRGAEASFAGAPVASFRN